MSTLQDFRTMNQMQADKAVSDRRHADLLQAHDRQSQAVFSAVTSLIQYLENHTSKTEVVNQLHEIGTPDALKVVTAVNDLHATLKTHENTDLSEVASLLKSVLAEAKAIPKDHPTIDIPSEVSLKNQVDPHDDLQALLEAVKAIKLHVEAPQVNVPAPEVKVEAPDLKPIATGLQAVKQAVEAITYPEIPKTDLSKLEKLQEKANKLLRELSDVQTSMSISASGGRATPYEDSAGIPHFVQVTSDGSIPVSPSGQLVPTSFDAISIPSYNANNDPLVVEYYQGGLSGTLVATLTMVYSGTNISSVVRS